MSENFLTAIYVDIKTPQRKNSEIKRSLISSIRDELKFQIETILHDTLVKGEVVERKDFVYGIYSSSDIDMSLDIFNRALYINTLPKITEETFEKSLDFDINIGIATIKGSGMRDELDVLDKALKLVFDQGQELENSINVSSIFHEHLLKIAKRTIPNIKNSFQAFTDKEGNSFYSCEVEKVMYDKTIDYFKHLI